METNELTPEVIDKATTAVKKHSRPNRSIALQPQFEPGDNTKLITHSIKLYNLGKVDMSDADAVEQRFIEYLQICAEDDSKVGVADFAMALGISRQELHMISCGQRGKNPAVVDTIKRAKSMIESQMEAYMTNGKINPVSAIFLCKNNFGYTDKQEIEVKAVNTLGDDVSKDEIAQKYIDALPGEVTEDSVGDK